MVLTNVRVVWFAAHDDAFNVSIPYMLLKPGARLLRQAQVFQRPCRALGVQSS